METIPDGREFIEMSELFEDTNLVYDATEEEVYCKNEKSNIDAMKSMEKEFNAAVEKADRKLKKKSEAEVKNTMAVMKDASRETVKNAGRL